MGGQVAEGGLGADVADGRPDPLLDQQGQFDQGEAVQLQRGEGGPGLHPVGRNVELGDQAVAQDGEGVGHGDSSRKGTTGRKG